MVRYGLYLSDLQRGRTRSQGIVNYAVGLANALPAHLRMGEELIIYANPVVGQELEMAKEASCCRVVMTPPLRSILERLWSDHVRVVQRARDDRVDVLHFPKGFLPILSYGIPLISTLHDDIQVKYASGQFGKNRGLRLRPRYFVTATKQALRRGSAVLTVSQFSKDCLLDMVQGGPIPSVVVTYQGMTLPVLAALLRKSKEPVLLHIGSTLPHKRSVDAVAWSLRYIQETAPWLRLRVLGGLPAEAEDMLHSHGGEHVPEVRTNADIADELRCSRALVFTSVYEGFGLPPVEALCLGTPAVYSSTSGTAEVMAGAPGGYNPEEGYSDFARGLSEALTLNDTQVCEWREHFTQKYSWEQAARRTLEVYRLVAGV